MTPSILFLQKGIRACSRHDGPEALKWLQRAVKGAPGLLPAWMLLGDVQQDLELYGPAIRSYGRALSLVRRGLGRSGFDLPLEAWPQESDILRALGSCTAAVGRLDEATALLREAVERGPQAANWVTLGEVLEARGELEEARLAFEAAVEADPRHVEALYRLGSWHMWTTPRRAEILFRRCLRRDPGHDRARAALGFLLASRGRVAQAERTLRRAARGGRAGSLPHVYLGHLAFQRGDAKEAEACYHKALEVDPTDPHPCFALGDLFRDQGRVAEAQAAYEGALQTDPACGDAALRLGTLHLEEGRKVEAARWFRRGLEMTPQHPWRDRIRDHLRALGAAR